MAASQAKPKQVDLNQLKAILELATQYKLNRLAIAGMELEFAHNVHVVAPEAATPEQLVSEQTSGQHIDPALLDPTQTPISEDEALYWASGYDPNQKPSEDPEV